MNIIITVIFDSSLDGVEFVVEIIDDNFDEEPNE